MTVPSVPLGELANVVSGGTPKRSEPSYFGGDVPWVKIGDMLQGTVASTEESITNAGLTGSSAKLLPAGTLLFSIFATIGRTAVLGIDAATNQAIAGLLIKDFSRVDRNYLRRYLEFASEGLADQGRGVAQANINLSILRAHAVPMPPIEEQRQIAAVLDAAEVLRAKRRRALTTLDSLTQAIFIDMFGDSGSDTWSTSPVADLAGSAKGSIRTGPFGSQLLHEEFVDDGPVAVLGIDNAVENRFVWGQLRSISTEKYEELKRYTVRPGDVLITIMGTCGRTAIVPDDIPPAINTKHLCCITLDQDRCLPEFLWACLRFHPDVLRQLGATRGAVMPGLNMGVIKRAEVPLPPLEVQKRFARSKEDVDQQVESSTTHLSRLDELFASLRQRAFRGEL